MKFLLDLILVNLVPHFLSGPSVQICKQMEPFNIFFYKLILK